MHHLTCVIAYLPCDIYLGVKRAYVGIKRAYIPPSITCEYVTITHVHESENKSLHICANIKTTETRNTMKEQREISNKAITPVKQKGGRKPMTKEVKANKKVHLFFTASDKEKLIELAKENNTTIGRFVKSVLMEYMLKHQRKKKAN